jgi:nitronate monooxygenase
MSRLQTPFCEMLGLRLPIIQAPMASVATVELVAAASAAGALGTFGFSYTQPDDMRRAAAAVRAATDKPFGINLFFAPQPGEIDADRQRDALQAIARHHAELALPPPAAVRSPYAPDLTAQLAAVAEIRPRVFTAHLGEIPVEHVHAIKAFGCAVGGTATCVAEAERLEALGFDFVIAQGGEAGGHRGSFLRDPYDALTGTLALTRLIVRAVKVPVVAAGGIMDGAGIAAALALGAQAAQLGTAFVATTESAAPAIYKHTLLAAREDDTRITEKFSGKPARGLANRFVREAEQKRYPQLAFPAQNSLTLKLRTESAKEGNPDFVAMWSGQGAPLARAMPAAELIAYLESETVEAIQRVSALIGR